MIRSPSPTSENVRPFVRPFCLKPTRPLVHSPVHPSTFSCLICSEQSLEPHRDHRLRTQTDVTISKVDVNFCEKFMPEKTKRCDHALISPISRALIPKGSVQIAKTLSKISLITRYVCLISILLLSQIHQKEERSALSKRAFPGKTFRGGTSIHRMVWTSTTITNCQQRFWNTVRANRPSVSLCFSDPRSNRSPTTVHVLHFSKSSAVLP